MPSGSLGFRSRMYRSRWRPSDDDVKAWRQYLHVLSLTDLSVGVSLPRLAASSMVRPAGLVCSSSLSHVHELSLTLTLTSSHARTHTLTLTSSHARTHTLTLANRLSLDVSDGSWPGGEYDGGGREPRLVANLSDCSRGARQREPDHGQLRGGPGSQINHREEPKHSSSRKREEKEQEAGSRKDERASREREPGWAAPLSLPPLPSPPFRPDQTRPGGRRARGGLGRGACVTCRPGPIPSHPSATAQRWAGTARRSRAGKRKRGRSAGGKPGFAAPPASGAAKGPRKHDGQGRLL